MPKAKITVVSDSISPRLKTLLSKAGDNSKKILLGMGVALQSWVVQSFTDKAKRIEPWKPKANVSQLISYQWDLKDFFRTQFYFINKIENILNL